MSIEQAIIDHAAAIRELAAAIQGAAFGVGNNRKTEPEKTVAQNKTAANVAKEAVASALGAVKESTAPREEDDPLADSAPLDYDKDVKPLLVVVGKDKSVLVALLEKFGAKNGAGIAKDDYAAVVAEANRIISARG